MEVVMIYSKQEAAKALRVSPVTIDRNRRIGKLPFHKIGRRVVFTETDISEFLDSVKVPAVSQQREANA
jgi:excisionase family DNA binding protein